MQVPSHQSDDAVDIRDYFKVVRRHLLLIVGVVVVCTGLAAAYSFTRVPMFTAKSEVLVLPPPNVTYRADELVSIETEARKVESSEVTGRVLGTLDWDTTERELRDVVSVATTPETLILDISFTDTSSMRAAEGANAFADAYLQHSLARATEANEAQTAGIKASIKTLQGQMDDAQAIMRNSSPGSSSYESASQEHDSLTGQMAVLVTQLASIPPATAPAEVIFEAEPPRAPSSPKHPLNLAMGLFLGSFLGLVLAFVRDRFDERVESRSELESAIQAPVLASIPRVSGWKKRGPAILVTARQPRSPAAEAFRTLRTSVKAMSRQKGYRVIGVVSPEPAEGKSSTTANLALTLAQADERVLVIGADLRAPRLHQYFGASNEFGLADVLAGDIPFDEAIRVVSPHLSLITAGLPPARPGELLQSYRMSELIARERQRYDFILIDCPPVLGFADSLAIAPFTDVLIMVANAETSSRNHIAQATDQIAQVGGTVIGGVLNNVSINRRAPVYGYGYGAAHRGGDRTPEDDGGFIDSWAGPLGARTPAPAGAPTGERRGRDRAAGRPDQP